jgi:hypothetical protein
MNKSLNNKEETTYKSVKERKSMGKNETDRISEKYHESKR